MSFVFAFRQQAPLRYFRAALLSLLYFGGVYLLSFAIQRGLAAVAPTNAPLMHDPAGKASALPELTRKNVSWVAQQCAIGFALTVLWFARGKDFYPVTRYVPPVMFAVFATLPLFFFMVFFYEWWIWMHWPVKLWAWRALAFVVSVTPGILVAQMLRFPRVDRPVTA